MPISTTGNAAVDSAAAEIAVALRDASPGRRDQHYYDEATRLRDAIMAGTRELDRPKTFSEMSPDERRIVRNRAAAQLQDELSRNADAIGRVLDSPPADEPGIREHVQVLHPRLLKAGLRTADDALLSSWHAEEHFRFSSFSHHHGPNAGPRARPRGWRDGSGVVLLEPRP
jgi:hypothetical protein